MSEKVTLTAAQAMVKYLHAQKVMVDGEKRRLFEGVFTIFGHGNVAGMGEALYAEREHIPTFRGHNEQGMAHIALGFAKAHRRKRMMAVTTSIGPGATNLVTAQALAYVNRLPLLSIPGDIFASRAPDPVLQQVENFQDGLVSANDCLRSVSRYFDRINRAEQLLTALPRAVQVLTDQANCGPVCLAFPQDVQTEAFDYPEDFFEERIVDFKSPSPDAQEVESFTQSLKASKKPLLIAGGGVLYSEGGTDALKQFVERHKIPVAETQAGKSALPWDHPQNLGALGVTGTRAANELVKKADLVIAVGSRLQDFTTGSHSLFNSAKLVSINANSFDAFKANSKHQLISDVAKALKEVSRELLDFQSPQEWLDYAQGQKIEWNHYADSVMRQVNDGCLPSDAQVIGAVQRSHPKGSSSEEDVVVGAAGGLPGELHKLWRASVPGNYYMEYGYSCMGHEIAAAIGVKMVKPEKEVIAMVGDGSYLMLNSEIPTSLALDKKIIIVLLDNRGFGCINRLQNTVGVPSFRNLLEEKHHGDVSPKIDFVKHAESLGARGVHVKNLEEFEKAILKARSSNKTFLISIDTDWRKSTIGGGHWWDVAIPEVSSLKTVNTARANYREQKEHQGY